MKTLKDPTGEIPIQNSWADKWENLAMEESDIQNIKNNLENLTPIAVCECCGYVTNKIQEWECPAQTALYFKRVTFSEMKKLMEGKRK